MKMDGPPYYTATGHLVYFPERPKRRRYFHRFNTKHDHQLTLIWRYEGFGLRTWPAANGRQKRAIHFGCGYLSWRIA